MRSGLRREDKVLMINKKYPRTLEESIQILKKSKNHIEFVVERKERQEREEKNNLPEERIQQNKGSMFLP